MKLNLLRQHLKMQHPEGLRHPQNQHTFKATVQQKFGEYGYLLTGETLDEKIDTTLVYVC